MTRLLACAALAAGLVAQDASAVLLTNQVRAVKGLGVGLNYGTPPTFNSGYDKPNMRIDNGGFSRLAPLGWDLGPTWSLYGQTNLVHSSFTIWTENGTSRLFNFAALADSAGLDGWDQATLHYTNTPGALPVNLVSEPRPDGGVNGNLVPKQQLDWPKIYNNTNLWQVNGGNPAVTADLANPATSLGSGLDQASRYTTPDVANVGSLTVNSNLTAWLKTDTDDLVTLIGVGGNNQNWWVGTNGTYVDDVTNGFVSIQPATEGERCRDSATLTLVFDVQFALLGGGAICADDPGVDVSLSDTEAGFDYLLYTNGVYAGQTVSGTGSSETFGLKNKQRIYTAVESNLTTSVTRLLPGVAVVFVTENASITAQPASYTSATNSVAYYELTVTGDELSLQWYKNGTPLSDDGHYWGTTTTQLKIDPVLASDAATTTDGYYCIITNPCGSVAISTTNALTVQPARNLVWRGTPANTWDIATTPNWFNSGTAANDVFHQGDNVLLDDTAVDTSVVVDSPYLSPDTITFNHSGEMTISASLFSEISGPNSKLVVNAPTGASKLIMASENSFGGGTTINDGWLRLENIKALGSGTITMAGTVLNLLEVEPGGAADRGLPGIHVAEDGLLQFNSGGAYSCVIFGPITGPAGKTLTFKRDVNDTPVIGDNFRVYGEFTLDSDLVLDMGMGSFATYGSGVTQTYNGVINDIGGARLYTRHGSGTIILNAANTFGGGVMLSGGITGIGNSQGLGSGTVGIEGNSTLFASGGPRTIANPVAFSTVSSGVRLEFSGTDPLTLSGTFDLAGAGVSNSVGRVIRVNTGGTAIVSGAISDGGYACTVTKDGNGLLLLNGVNTYTGTTTVSAGALGGSGTIAGSVVVSAAGSLAPGASVGTLNVNGNLTMSGTLAIEVNKALSPGQSNDFVQVTGTLSGATGAKVTVNNLGPTPGAGDRFVLFNKPMTSGSLLTVTGAGMVWTNKLAVDGSIEVVAPIATTPTDLTYSVIGGTNVTLSWPINYKGWSLQTQSNPLGVGLSNNWTTVAGSENATSVTVSLDPSKSAVFYRMFYLAP